MKVLLFISMFFLYGANIAFSQYSGGDGSSENPFQIATLTDLETLIVDNSNHDKHFVQTADIDVSEFDYDSNPWGLSPVGYSGFSGTYDGQKFKILNLHQTYSGNNDKGMFGYTTASAILKNIHIENYYSNARVYNGALVAHNYGRIDSCFVSGTIISGGSRSQYVGGLVGSNYGVISSSFANVNATINRDNCGGLVGENYGTINSSYAIGSVHSNENNCGGLVGKNHESGIINNSYSTGLVTTPGVSLGGLVGENLGEIYNCFYDRETSGRSDDDGRGTPKFSSEMKTQATFTSWDFDEIWRMGYCATDGNYPEHQWRNPFHKGLGTELDPYQISSLNELQNLSNNTCLWDKYFIQTANIEAAATSTWNSGLGFSPIGNAVTSFSGNYDGNRFTISNLTINRPSQDDIALFGFINGGSISNLGLVGGSVSGHSRVGSLVGYSSGSVTNSYATGSVIGVDSYIGGLVGNSNGSVTSSFATGDVDGHSFVGGLVGSSDQEGSILNSYARGNVSGNISFGTVGGLVGRAYANVLNCYATGTVSGEFIIGGLVGEITNSVTNCFYLNNPNNGFGTQISDEDFKMKGTFSAVNWDFLSTWTMGDCLTDGYPKLAWEGALNGNGTIEDPHVISSLNDLKRLSENQCLWDKHFIQTTDIDATETLTWNVFGNTAYGLDPVGNLTTNFTGSYNGQGYTISNLFIRQQQPGSPIGFFGKTNNASISNLGIINGHYVCANYNGGLVGEFSGEINNCYTDVYVFTGGINNGGLVGINAGIIRNSYAMGSIVGLQTSGGFVGKNNGTIENCYSLGQIQAGTSGGFAGENFGTINNCFYNSETSLRSDNDGRGVPIVTTEMQDQSTFSNEPVNWNFSTIWKMGECSNNGYPIFQWQTTQARPTISNSIAASRCGTGTVELGATASAGVVNWYADASGGISIHTGETYSPSISSTTTYYAEADNGGCVSASRTEVVGAVSALPTVTVPSTFSRCGAGTLTLTASTDLGELRWYNAAVDGDLLHTGASFTTPSISETTSYWVGAVNETCASARTEVLAKTDCSSTMSPTFCGSTIASNLGTQIECAPVAGAVSYRFEVTGPGGTSNVDRSTPYIHIYNIPNYNWNETYSIRVASSSDGISYGTFGASCDVSSPATLTTQVQTSQCNTTLGATTDFIAADAVGTPHYRFRINGGEHSNHVITKTARWFYLSELPSYTLGQTYAVSVAVSINGTDFQDYGTACNITVPATISTQIQASHCNITLGSTTDFVYADNVGASRYRFRLTADGYDEVVTKSVRWLYLSDLPSYAPSTTYAVTVAVSIDGGATFGSYGSSCNLTTPGAPTTQIQSSHCNITLGSTTDFVYADNVGASRYRFRLTADGYDEVVTKSVRWLYLSDLPSYAPSTTYAVTVAVSIDGGATFGSYGSSCNLTTPGAPTTQIQSSHCNITLGSTTDFVYADNVGASRYRFRLTADGYDEVVTKSVRWLYLSDLPSYAPNTTYAVTVAVSIDGGATFGSYGSSCNLTTPGAPTTQIQSSHCNITLGSTTDFVYADNVGASRYRFRLTADGYDEVVTKSVRWLYLSDLPSYALSTTYEVTVAVSIDGGVTFGSYGSSCNLTTPGAEGKIVISDNEIKSPTHAMIDTYMNVYPNPSRGEVTVVSSHEGTYRVVNELGQIVQEFEITKEKNYQTRINLSNGVYFVTGVINDETVTKKVVVLN
jgi:hypothetical protein